MVRFMRVAFCFILVLSFVGGWLQLGRTRYSDVHSRLVETSMAQLHHSNVPASSIESPDEQPTSAKAGCHHRGHFPSIALVRLPAVQTGVVVDRNVASSGTFDGNRIDIFLRPPSVLI